MGGWRAGSPNSRVLFPTSMAVTSLLQQPQAPAQHLGFRSYPKRAAGQDGGPSSKPSTLCQQPKCQGVPAGHQLPVPTHTLVGACYSLKTPQLLLKTNCPSPGQHNACSPSTQATQLFRGDVFSHAHRSQARGSLLFSIQGPALGSSCLPASWDTRPRAAAATLSRSSSARCAAPGQEPFCVCLHKPLATGRQHQG